MVTYLVHIQDVGYLSGTRLECLRRCAIASSHGRKCRMRKVK